MRATFENKKSTVEMEILLVSREISAGKVAIGKRGQVEH